MSLSTVGKHAKYGLISKKPSAVPVAPKPRVAAFSMDDSDEDDNTGGNDVSRVNAQLARRNAANVAAMNATLAAEDPSIYDYDGAYDSFKAEKVTTHHLSQSIATQEAPKSRYVSNLLSTAKMREKEKERVYEKKLLKERTEEDKEFGDKPKFMTTAYKKKLLEDQKWEYEDKLADEVEQRTDVRKSGMQGFYKNLLTKNVALGGDVDAHAVSVYTAGSARQSHLLDGPTMPALSSSREGGHDGSKGERDGDSHASEKAEDELMGDSSIYKDTRVATNSDGNRKRDTADHDSDREGLPSAKLARLGGEVANPSITDASRSETAVPTATTVHVPEPVQAKGDQIMSARDRYLARKVTQQL